jgi:hypothetical protein
VHGSGVLVGVGFVERVLRRGWLRRPLIRWQRRTHARISVSITVTTQPPCIGNEGNGRRPQSAPPRRLSRERQRAGAALHPAREVVAAVAWMLRRCDRGRTRIVPTLAGPGGLDRSTLIPGVVLPGVTVVFLLAGRVPTGAGRVVAQLLLGRARGGGHLGGLAAACWSGRRSSCWGAAALRAALRAHTLRTPALRAPAALSRLHGLLHHLTEHAGLPAQRLRAPPACCAIWPTCPSMLVSCPTDC